MVGLGVLERGFVAKTSSMPDHREFQNNAVSSSNNASPDNIEGGSFFFILDRLISYLLPVLSKSFLFKLSSSEEKEKEKELTFCVLVSH